MKVNLSLDTDQLDLLRSVLVREYRSQISRRTGKSSRTYLFENLLTQIDELEQLPEKAEDLPAWTVIRVAPLGGFGLIAEKFPGGNWYQAGGGPIPSRKINDNWDRVEILLCG